MNGEELPASTWETFVQQYGEFGLVSVERGPILRSPRTQQQQEQHQIYQGWTPPPEVIEFRQSFVFDLDSPIDGYLLSLQWIAGTWRTFALSPTEHGMAISTGLQRIPPQATGKHGMDLATHSYREDTEGGLHRLAFLIAPETMGRSLGLRLLRSWQMPDDELVTLVRLMLEIPRPTWRLLRLDMLFPSEPVDNRGGPLHENGQRSNPIRQE